MAIRFQIAFIYAHALLGKLAETEWMDGTAMYYWFLHPAVGLSPSLLHIADAILRGKIIIFITWSVLLLEAGLACSIFLKPTIRLLLLVPAIGLHLLIAMLMGITSFSVAMVAALLIYLPEPGTRLSYFVFSTNARYDLMFRLFKRLQYAKLPTN